MRHQLQRAYVNCPYCIACHWLRWAFIPVLVTGSDCLSWIPQIYRNEISNLAEVLKDKLIKRQVERMRYCLKGSTLGSPRLRPWLEQWRRQRFLEGTVERCQKLTCWFISFPWACIRSTDPRTEIIYLSHLLGLLQFTILLWFLRKTLGLP